MEAYLERLVMSIIVYAIILGIGLLERRRSSNRKENKVSGAMMLISALVLAVQIIKLLVLF